MMEKTVSADAWKEALWGEETPRAMILKTGSQGAVTGRDKTAFEKRAAATSEELLAKVAQLDVSPGEVLVHLIALGATEVYGPNRNGDGFSKEACRKFHPWFVKEARVYRDHKNKDKSRSYGVVKASAYNEQMSRIELIVALNGTEKAASHNGGLVADRELEKLEDGDFPVSMACFLDPKFPILTKEKGYIAIEDVAVGDLVWTKDSGWQPVTGLNRRVYTGDAYTIWLEDLAFPIEVTADHLFWATDSLHRSATSGPEDRAEWVRADMLTQDSWLCFRPSDIRWADVERLTKTHTKSGPSDLYTTLTIRDAEIWAGVHHGIAIHPIPVAAGYPDGPAQIVSLCLPRTRQNDARERGIYAHRVERIESRPVDGVQTYNFEVANDPSYSAAGIISHNCRVPFDVCSFCGNRAVSQNKYCRGTDEGGHCKAGGLARRMGRLVTVDGKLHTLYADNLEPQFFDISHVTVPADRIAYTSGKLTKSGAYLPEEQLPYTFQPNEGDSRSQIMCAAVDNYHASRAWAKKAACLAFVTSEPLTAVKVAWRYKTASVMRALSDAGVCLTAPQFLQLAGAQNNELATSLGEIIAPLSNEMFSKLSHVNRYRPAERTCEALREWVHRQHLPSFFERDITKRAALAAVRPMPRQQYSTNYIYTLLDDPVITRLATEFALYKTAFVESLPPDQQPWIADLVVERDYVRT